MASSDKNTTSYSHDTARTAPETTPSAGRPTSINFFVIDLALRLLLFALTLVALVVLVTSKQTEMVIVSPFNPVQVSRTAQFKNSPAFIYLVVAACVGCLYSIVTTFASLAAISKPSPSNKLLFLLAIQDAVMAGVLGSATGAAGGVAYVGLKGNRHVPWTKICNVYNKFCKHTGSSVALTLVASIVLLLLVFVSTYSLYRRSR